ncbi:MAG: glycosyltransferase family 2 protein [Tumebacillaceae bacterium]
MFAVIPARNEASRITSAIRTVRQVGIEQIVVVINGCHDNTRHVAQSLQAGDLTLLTFREALGVDVPRAVGAAYALSKGARHVLFYDGDLIGPHRDELQRMVTTAQRFSIDLGLTDIHGTTKEQHANRDLLTVLRRELSNRLGLEARIGLSNPAHGPSIVSRKLLETLPLEHLAKPPLVLAHAARSGLHIDTLAHIPHAKLGSAHKGPTHFERIRDTIIGDLLEAITTTKGYTVSREHRGLYYDGYDSERRFDLLEAFVKSLR